MLLASVSFSFGVIVMLFLSPLKSTLGASGLRFFKRSLAGIVIFGSAPSFTLYEPSAFFSGTNL